MQNHVFQIVLNLENQDINNRCREALIYNFSFNYVF